MRWGRSRRRPVREDPRPGPVALADWNSFDAACGDGARRLRGAARHLPRVDQRQRVRAGDGRRCSGDGVVQAPPVMPMGRASRPNLAQLTVDVFGVPIEGASASARATPTAPAASAAPVRARFTGGAAVRVASENTVERRRFSPAEALEIRHSISRYRAGRFTITGTDRGIGLFELAPASPRRRVFMDRRRRQRQRAELAERLPYYLCEVEIDPDFQRRRDRVVRLGQRRRSRREPTIVRGQLEGGAVQGIGQALGEVLRYEPEAASSSAPASWTTRCRVPIPSSPSRPCSTPPVPCSTNLLGVKGVGELGTIGATPAVVNAVVDALAASGWAAPPSGCRCRSPRRRCGARCRETSMQSPSE